MTIKARFAVATLSLGLVLPLFGTATPVHAASWHNGMPAALRGKWRATFKLYGSKGTAKLNVNKKAFTFSPAFPPQNLQTIGHVKYRKTGKQTYAVTGRDYDNAPAGGFKVTFTFKTLKHHKVHFNFKGTARKDINGTYTRY